MTDSDDNKRGCTNRELGSLFLKKSSRHLIMQSSISETNNLSGGLAAQQKTQINEFEDKSIK